MKQAAGWNRRCPNGGVTAMWPQAKKMWAASDSWEGKEVDSLLEPLEVILTSRIVK